MDFYLIKQVGFIASRDFVPDENPEGELLRHNGAAVGVLGDRQREPVGGDAHDPGHDGSAPDLTQKRIDRKGLKVLRYFLRWLT